MIPEKIIKLAIEGGYKGIQVVQTDIYPVALDGEEEHPRIILDPLFWASLGKALDWVDYKDPEGRDMKIPFGLFQEQHWKTRANQFFNLLLTNGDTEKFWADLIK